MMEMYFYLTDLLRLFLFYTLHKFRQLIILIVTQYMLSTLHCHIPYAVPTLSNCILSSFIDSLIDI